MINTDFYFKRFGIRETLLHEPIPDNLKLIVVIPCYQEENLFKTLDSFLQNDFQDFSVEVITVINCSENSSDEIKKEHQKLFDEGLEWARLNNNVKILFRFILENNLPKKHAGVGLARKIGMDEALRRFSKSNHDGIIICADADAFYPTNFLQEVHDHFFIRHILSQGCSIYFEHPLSGNEFEDRIYQGILKYELFLRYYKNALKYCEFPFAFHTIGSSMACRASVYAKVGGMNKRQAGEDFYFLQKIIELGNFTELNSTTIIPSPRVSNRVPFGTGKAVGDWMKKDDDEWEVYAIEIFDELKKWMSIIPKLFHNNLKILETIHPTLKQFLLESGLFEKVEECLKNTKTQEMFVQRMLKWSDAFLILKACHFLRDHGFGTADVFDSSKALLNRLNINFNGTNESLIEQYRRLDKL